MTLDEAITHAREVAEKNKRAIDFESIDSVDDDIKMNCLNCAEQHEQLAVWLEDYKRLKSEKEQDIYERAYKDGYDKGSSDGNFFGYNKAIDDFVKSLYKIGEHKDFDWEDIYELADQLKGSDCDI